MPLISFDPSSELNSVEVRATLIADILTSIYGDSADTLIDSNATFSKSISVDGFFKAAKRVLKPRSRSVDPRDADGDGRIFDGTPQEQPARGVGRFQKKNTDAQIAAIHAHIEEALKGNRTPQSANQLVEKLGQLTVKELRDIKLKYGMAASGRNKAELVAKIAARLDSGRRADHSVNPVRHAHPGVKLNDDQQYALQRFKVNERNLTPGSSQAINAARVNAAIDKVRSGQPLTAEEKDVATKALTASFQFVGSGEGGVQLANRRALDAVRASLTQLGVDPESTLTSYRQQMADQARQNGGVITVQSSTVTPEPQVKQERPPMRSAADRAERARREVMAAREAAQQKPQESTKPGHELTLEEYRQRWGQQYGANTEAVHRRLVQRALDAGTPVPDRVIDSHPDLRPKPKVAKQAAWERPRQLAHHSLTATDPQGRYTDEQIAQRQAIDRAQFALDTYNVAPDKYRGPDISQDVVDRLTRRYPNAAPRGWDGIDTSLTDEDRKRIAGIPGATRKAFEQTGIAGFWQRAMMLKEVSTQQPQLPQAPQPEVIRDGDGDGVINDGTPQERPADPRPEPQQEAPKAEVNPEEPTVKVTDKADTKVSMRRVQKVIDDAKAIEWTDDSHELTTGSNEYGTLNDDFDEQQTLDWIKENDPHAVDRMFEAMSEIAYTAADEAWYENKDVYLPEPVQSEVDENAGYSNSDVNNKVQELLEGNEEAINAVDEWYHDSNATGIEAFDEIEKALESAGIEITPETLKKLEQMKERAVGEIEVSRDEMIQAGEDDARQSFIDDFTIDYDDYSDREQWLRDYWRDNLQGSLESEPSADEVPRDTWFNGTSGKTLIFDTENGWYEINAHGGKNHNFKMDEYHVTFNDQQGSFARTGDAGPATALRVMDKVSASMLAFLNNTKEPSIMYFSAQSEARQNVYERMVKTVAKISGKHVAFKISGASATRDDVAYFVIVPRAIAKEAPAKLMQEYGQNSNLQMIVKSFSQSRKYPVRVTRLRQPSHAEIYKWLTEESVWQ